MFLQGPEQCEDGMPDDKTDRTMELQCPTCGDSTFRFREADAPIICNHCGRSLTREELINENGELVETALEEMAPEFISASTSQIRSALRDALKGSKSLTFK